MDHHNTELLKIGLFSTLSRISVRMLRHYQEHGLLVPTHIDPWTGHRFYSAAQLKDAFMVTLLRDAGFPIEEMPALLAGTGDPSSIACAIEVQRLRLQSARDGLFSQLAALDRVSSTLKESPSMFDVTRSTLPTMTIVALRQTIASYADEGMLWQELMPLVVQAGAAFPAEGISGSTFYDAEHRETDVDVEVWLQVAAPAVTVPPLECRTVPDQEVVMTTIRGDYALVPAATAAIGAYIAEHGLMTGPMFNIYRVSPAQNPDPSSWVTDLCFPVLGAGSLTES